MKKSLMSGALAIAMVSLAACTASGGSASNSGDSGMGQSAVGVARYSAGSGCPGTNEAGNTWHPGEYCLPGGRS